MMIKTCPRGHRISGGNVAWYVTHGLRRRRCRQCRATYMRRYMRAQRANRNTRRGKR